MYVGIGKLLQTNGETFVSLKNIVRNDILLEYSRTVVLDHRVDTIVYEYRMCVTRIRDESRLEGAWRANKLFL